MENQPKPTENNSPQLVQEQAKPAKEKKPRTEAQKQATVKALAAMTAARKARAEKQIEKKEEIKKAKKVVEEKILKEDIGFALKNDVDSKISSLMREVGELRGLLTAKQQAEKEKPAPKAERVVERVIERVPTPQAQPTKLTGHALLDKLFFEK